MGHRRDIADDILARQRFAQREGNRRFRLFKFRRIDDIADMNDAALLIRYLDADGVLPRNRRFDPDIGGREIEREVVLEVCDLADLNARRRLDFIARDGRSGLIAADLRVDAEVAERLADPRRIVADLILCGPSAALALRQKLDGRKLIKLRLFLRGFRRPIVRRPAYGRLFFFSSEVPAVFFARSSIGS